MIKCPKCRSEVRHTIAGYYCNGCDVYFTAEQLDEMEHQQRLENVLKHFDDAGDYLCCKNMIVYDGEFSFEWDYKIIYISLDTVECLLRDLGVMK